MDSNIFKYSSFFVIGASFTILVLKINKHFFKSKKKLINSPGNKTEELIIDNSIVISENNFAQNEELIREQLKRNYEFFGVQGMEFLKNSFVVVVGIGGVGSHTVMTLIRSGVGKIRIIDYDVVTLSSLNRHAFALRQDVGRLKVKVVKEYASKINPYLIIEAIDDAYCPNESELYILKDNPDYIIDCIDDLEAKVSLFKFCDDNSLRLISSMGAGSKCDPTCIRLTDFQFVQSDRIAKRMRHLYKKNYGKIIPNIKTIYSIEKVTRGLTDLEEHQKEDMEMHRINDNERIRSLPVFASIPAIFGQALASVVLCDLAKIPIEYNANKNNELLDVEEEEYMVGNVTLRKLYEDCKKDEIYKKKIKYKNY